MRRHPWWYEMACWLIMCVMMFAVRWGVSFEVAVIVALSSIYAKVCWYGRP